VASLRVLALKSLSLRTKPWAQSWRFSGSVTQGICLKAQIFI
jgi:hypothetical protein